MTVWTGSVRLVIDVSNPPSPLLRNDYQHRKGETRPSFSLVQLRLVRLVRTKRKKFHFVIVDEEFQK